MLNGCILDEDTFAPVTEINTIEPIPKQGVHRVMPDETLYSIAWRYGLDYRYIAKRNHISPPYNIEIGQLIYLTKNKPTPNRISPVTSPQSPRQQTKPIVKIPVIKPSIIEKEPSAKVNQWRWPAKGPTIGTFSSLNKGINIGGNIGDPIVSTAAGKVVYSGNGLRGYGNLIIIKHNSTFLTAYAHNSKIFVKDGDWVNSGQKIAEMGNTGTQRLMLHFEIRRNGQPVNPLMYLTQNI